MKRALLTLAIVLAAAGTPLVAVQPALAGGPTITVSKTHTGSFTVGGTGTFTIQLSEGVCCGSTGSTQFTVTDTLPTGLTYHATGSGNGTWTCGATGQTVQCSATPAILSNSSSSFPIVVDVLPTAFPSVTNSATVSDNSCTNCVSYVNNPASDTVSVVLATPPSYTKEPGNGTGFPTVLNSFQATGLAQTVTTTDGTKTVTLALPAGALPPTTQVTLYRGSAAPLQADLASGTYVDGYAVGWVLAGRTFTASNPITMTVHDPAVTTATVIYVTTGSALATTAATVTAGQYVVSFTADPGFVAAGPIAVPATGAGTGWLTALLLVVGGAGLLGFGILRRRTRTA